MPERPMLIETGRPTRRPMKKTPNKMRLMRLSPPR
jgi:hypothetical protein